MMRARQKVSRAGVELIKSFEGLRQTAARLPDGRWTLGYGHTFSAREGARVTQEDADALLRFDLLPIVDALNNLVLVPINQNQFDALVSFCFNIGVDNFAASTVLKRTNEGRMTEAALAMDAWRSAEFNGQTYVLAPLIRRRAAEKNLFLTPEDAAGNAPTLLVRPVEDGRNEALTNSPSELNAPDRGGILSAYPVGQPQPAPQPQPAHAQVPLPYASPYAAPIAPQPLVQPAPQPVERQMIDLAQFAPQPAAPQPVVQEPAPQPVPYQAPYQPPYQAPAETVVEQLPQGLMSSSAIRETPVESAPTSFAAPTYEPEPVMSADTQAALARAQEEQRLREETLRQSQALAAARSAEEARLREAARLQEEARMHEQQRLDAQRAEQNQAEQARLEQAKLEQARLEQERAEAERMEAFQREQARLEQERLEQERQEQARLEQARLEQERGEQARLEQERLEQERQEQARQEQARLEQERIERERAEQARLDQARLEAERLEREKAAQAVAAPAISPEDAEKARKAEAAAALMRLYSPYGSGALGRPLGGPLTPAPAPKPEPIVAPVPEPEPQAFSNHSIISPSAAESTPIDISARAEDVAPIVRPAPEPEPEPRPTVLPFAPVVSASSMPAPVITALNPYARPLPAETVVEVPRPAPVDLSSSASAQAAAQTAAKPEAALNWREQLQRPLPSDYKPPETSSQPEQASLLRASQATRFDDMYDEDNEDWTMDGGRIALSSEVMEEEGASWWTMIVSTFWWIFISVLGLASLGVAAAAYYKSKDMTVIRNGFFHDYMMLSVITATVGILLVSVSVWLIMRRLGGLKD